jgi:hypothetical protein
MQPHLLIWQGYDGRSYGIETKDDKVYRMIGIYDAGVGQWQRMRKLLLLEQVSLLFEYEQATVSGYAMLHAITIINQKDQLRSNMVLANTVCRVPHG